MARNQSVQLAVTLGDPAGIGPEVVLKALADPIVTAGCDVTIVGSRSLLDQAYDRLRPISAEPLADPADLNLINVALESSLESAIVLGQESAASGEASFRYLQTAIAAAMAGQFQGIVTGPIAKSAWKVAGHEYPGQTELLAEQSGVDRFGMLFIARSPHTGWTLRALLATTHIPLRQVADSLTPALLTRKLALLIECLDKDFGLTTPRIAIAGLNPHSGEQGQLGQEEQAVADPLVGGGSTALPSSSASGADSTGYDVGQAWSSLVRLTFGHGPRCLPSALPRPGIDSGEADGLRSRRQYLDRLTFCPHFSRSWDCF